MGLPPCGAVEGAQPPWSAKAQGGLGTKMGKNGNAGEKDFKK